MIACFTVFVYDYLLTINDEIDYIWRKRFSLVTFCFFVNRYYAMCEFILSVFANFSLDFSANICKRYVAMDPFGEGLPFTILPDFVIGLRVYALYGRKKYIGIALATYIAAEMGVAFWIYLVPSVHALPLPDPPGANQIPELHLCLAVVSDNLSHLKSATFQLMQTIYDSVAFLMILLQTVRDGFGGGLQDRDSIQAVIAKHGLLYYVAVFSANLTWALMIVLSPPILRYSAAMPTIIVACLSANKITLSLRAFNEPANSSGLRQVSELPWTQAPRLKRRRSWIGASTFETGDNYIPETAAFNSLEHAP